MADVLKRDLSLYRLCPLQHHYGKEEELIEKKLRVLFGHYFARSLERKQTSLQYLERKWQKIWFQDIELEDILFGENVDRTKPGFQAFKWIHHFYRLANQLPHAAVASRHPYKLKIAGHTLRGEFDALQEVQDGFHRILELIIYRFDSRLPSDFELATDLEISIDSYAMRKTFGIKEQRISLWFIQHGIQKSIYRDGSDYLRMVKSLKPSLDQLERDEVYPRHGAHCTQCPHQNRCLMWPDRRESNVD